MKRAWLIILTLTLLWTLISGRTLDIGREDAEQFTHPLPGMMRLPLLESENQVLGLNDIQSGLKDKDAAPSLGADAITSVPAAPESNDIEPIEAAVEEGVEDLQESEVRVDQPVPVEPIEDEEEYEEDIFQDEQDMTVIMRRMYSSLYRRITMLKYRVTSVEKTARDVLTRLTVLDCADLQAQGKPSGVYTFHMDHNGKRPVTAVCDMETDGGGWTVIQKRRPHSKEVDFNRGWHDYKLGFGNASTDYWVGLENMYIWTNSRHYELRIDLTDFESESAYALYDRFYLENEQRGYRLHVSGYSGTAGDSLTNEGEIDNFTAVGMKFTTNDMDHDTSHEINCARYWKIGGWWFNRCSWANLNGPYKEPGEGDGIGINWHMWRNKEYLRSSTMMIRPARKS